MHHFGSLFDAMSVQPKADTPRGNLAGFNWSEPTPRFDQASVAGEGERNAKLSTYAWKLLHERTSLTELPGLVADYNATHCEPRLEGAESETIVNAAVRSFASKFPEK